MTISNRVELGQEKIALLVSLLSMEIDRDFNGKEVLLIGILNGAFIFLSDLSRSLKIDHSIEFIKADSYRDNTTSSGVVTINPSFCLDRANNQNIILVDCILDSGKTMKEAILFTKKLMPKSISFCVLLSKIEKSKLSLWIDGYIGSFVDKSKFLIGYGLDLRRKKRGLRDILRTS